MPKYDEITTVSGDNRKYLQNALKTAAVKRVDYQNPEEVKERVNEYFQTCVDDDCKPTMAGLALALGEVNRQRLWEIRTGTLKGGTTRVDYPEETLYTIRKACFVLEQLWEDYMLNGKINPASGIFYGKNHFGYRDEVEVKAVATSENASDIDVKAIKDRY